MSKTAIFPGTFDPVTLGHLDVIKRIVTGDQPLVDHLMVAVAADPMKKTKLNLAQRQDCMAAAVASLKGGACAVSIVSFDGLLIDYVQEVQADFIVRGMRSPIDFSYEWHMAHMNRSMSKGKVDTLFLMTAPELAHVSSSMVRDIMRHNGDISAFVSDDVRAYLADLGLQRVSSD